MPVNEISFFSWASGDEGIFYPFMRGKGDEIKRQLVRAAIACIEAVRSILPSARIVHTEPLINVIARRPEDERDARRYLDSQFAALDMIAGRLNPELGGHEKYLDILGLNYYVHNQWFYPDRTMIQPAHPLYRPLRELLCGVYERYQHPLFIAETGIEDDLRPDWLRCVADEARAAILDGIPLEGICLYPILNHPGWEDDRHCHNGLWDYADAAGNREAYEPLACELRRQSYSFENLRSAVDEMGEFSLDQSRDCG